MIDPRTRRSGGAVALAVLLSAMAVGCAPGARSAGPTAPPAPSGGEPRVVRIATSDDLRFVPDRVVVRAGETIRFVTSNPGLVIHDLTIGDVAAQARHEAQMRTFFGRPGPLVMRGHETAVLVEPGATAQLVVTFGAPGTVLMGCHVPGHWDARMRGVVDVLAVEGALPGGLHGG